MIVARVLVVDDDPSIRELLVVNLEKRGFTVDSLGDGREVLDNVARESPDIVILDVMMPYVDGWEICKMIRDNPRFSGIKILMLTARDSMRDRMIGKDILKADEYITKPFVLADLMEAIRRLLRD